MYPYELEKRISSQKNLMFTATRAIDSGIIQLIALQFKQRIQKFIYNLNIGKMDTPPNTGTARPNFMHFRRGVDGEEDVVKNNEMMMKFGPKYQLYKKELPVTNQRENVPKIMAEMKKQLSFLDNTRWMFENNPSLHIDNYSANSL